MADKEDSFSFQKSKSNDQTKEDTSSMLWHMTKLTDEHISASSDNINAQHSSDNICYNGDTEHFEYSDTYNVTDDTSHIDNKVNDNLEIGDKIPDEECLSIGDSLASNIKNSTTGHNCNKNMQSSGTSSPEDSNASNGDEGFIESLPLESTEDTVSSASQQAVNKHKGVTFETSVFDGDASCLSSEAEDGGSGAESDLEDNVDLDDPDEYPMDMKWQLRNPNPELPETVAVLQTPDGSKVFLVGTAHFSLESQEDVAKTIRATQPDIVMVELCKSRVNILSLDEKTILEESKNMNIEKIRAAIKQNGLVQGVMYLLLLSMSAHLTKQLGMAPGGEFRRAFTEAKKIPGCLIHLGDRPIHITLQRALASLSWWQKLRLAWYMVTSKEPISKEEVERCKQRDLLEEMLAEMTGEFPALSKVFVQERDIYLAYSLRLAATPIHCPKAPNGVIPSVVVGVVGIGHVPGIVSNWDTVSEIDIPPVLQVPPASITSKVLRHTFQISLLGLAVWSCYRFLLPSAVAEAISPRRPIEWLSHWINR